MRLSVWQWTSKSLRNKHSLHPTFTHGSTLGLYEVLNGKPYICDMIADSVVLCFFIEAEKILALLRSDPAVEDFLWQVWSYWVEFETIFLVGRPVLDINNRWSFTASFFIHVTQVRKFSIIHWYRALKFTVHIYTMLYWLVQFKCCNQVKQDEISSVDHLKGK